jgi:hypothetical protein
VKSDLVTSAFFIYRVLLMGDNIDLRHRFGLPAQAYGLHAPIILADISGDGRILGLIVDAVADSQTKTSCSDCGPRS